MSTGPQYTIPEAANRALTGNNGRYTADSYPAPTHQEGTTEMGTPYYGAIVFKLTDADAKPYTLIDCVYTLTEAATIVRELPAGETDARKGSVLELTAIDDFDIQIAGRLTTNHNERMPTDELQLMREKIKAGAVLEVENREFNILGIKQLAIVSITYKAEPGELNTLYVDIKAYSHTPDELLINDVDNPTENL